MSDAVFEDFASGMAELNTALQSEFGRDGARLFLLKRGQQTGTFEQNDELTSGWRVEYGEIRDEIFFFYSTSEAFSDMWAKTTHIGYGVPVSNEVFAYEIEPGQKERTLPDIFSDEWKAFAVRKGNERHAIVETYYFATDGNQWTTDGNYWVI